MSGGKYFEAFIRAILKPKIKVYLFRIISILFFLPFLALPFIGFDQHHDGLMLTTVHFYQEFFQKGSLYPFNQYGPAWPIPFALVSSIFSPEYSYLVMRFFVILCFGFTAFLIGKTTSLFTKNLNVKFLAIWLFLLSEPFNTNFGSSLIAWPSAEIMPLIVGSLYCTLKILKADSSARKYRDEFYLLLMAVSIVFIFFSRIQVGLALFLVELFSLWFSSNRKSNYRIYFVFLMLSGATLLIPLQLKGWLSPALHDEIIFGSSYLRGDTSTYPTPIFTILGTFVFCLLLHVLYRLSLRHIKIVYRLSSVKVWSLFGLCTFGVILILSSRHLRLIDLIVVFSRRLWISATLAIVVYATFLLGSKFIRSRRNLSVNVENLPSKLVLIGFAVASESQIYPLFDQMHFWWGASTSFILFAIIIVSPELWSQQKHFRSLLDKKWISLSLVGLTLMMLIPWFAQIADQRASGPKQIISGISLPNHTNVSMRQSQRFFARNIPSGSSVLNLCSNADVFFQKDKYHPSSRVFLFWWPSISSDQAYVNSQTNSHPDYIVSCTLNQVPVWTERADKFLSNLIDTSFKNFVIKSSMKDEDGKIWVIRERPNS